MPENRKNGAFTTMIGFVIFILVAFFIEVEDVNIKERHGNIKKDSAIVAVDSIQKIKINKK